MSETTFSRRNVLVTIATTAAIAATVSEADAQHVHEAVSQTKAAGPYHPKAFTEHETKTLRALCEIIVPGASQGGAFEYIDLLSSNNAELKAIYTGGMLWLDNQMKLRAGSSFVDAQPADQTALLDIIAFRQNAKEYGPGVRFFDWVRKMTVDAYYSSAAGIKELGFTGNTALSEFVVPAECLDYALKRSGLE